MYKIYRALFSTTNKPTFPIYNGHFPKRISIRKNNKRYDNNASVKNVLRSQMFNDEKSRKLYASSLRQCQQLIQERNQTCKSISFTPKPFNDSSTQEFNGIEEKEMQHWKRSKLGKYITAGAFRARPIRYRIEDQAQLKKPEDSNRYEIYGTSGISKYPTVQKDLMNNILDRKHISRKEKLPGNNLKTLEKIGKIRKGIQSFSEEIEYKEEQIKKLARVSLLQNAENSRSSTSANDDTKNSLLTKRTLTHLEKMKWEKPKSIPKELLKLNKSNSEKLKMAETYDFIEVTTPQQNSFQKGTYIFNPDKKVLVKPEDVVKETINANANTVKPAEKVFSTKSKPMLKLEDNLTDDVIEKTISEIGSTSKKIDKNKRMKRRLLLGKKRKVVVQRKIVDLDNFPPDIGAVGGTKSVEHLYGKAKLLEDYSPSEQVKSKKYSTGICKKQVIELFPNQSLVENEFSDDEDFLPQFHRNYNLEQRNSEDKLCSVGNFNRTKSFSCYQNTKGTLDDSDKKRSYMLLSKPPIVPYNIKKLKSKYCLEKSKISFFGFPKVFFSSIKKSDDDKMDVHESPVQVIRNPYENVFGSDIEIVSNKLPTKKIERVNSKELIAKSKSEEVNQVSQLILKIRSEIAVRNENMERKNQVHETNVNLTKNEDHENCFSDHEMKFDPKDITELNRKIKNIQDEALTRKSFKENDELLIPNKESDPKLEEILYSWNKKGEKRGISKHVEKESPKSEEVFYSCNSDYDQSMEDSEINLKNDMVQFYKQRLKSLEKELVEKTNRNDEEKLRRLCSNNPDEKQDTKDTVKSQKCLLENHAYKLARNEVLESADDDLKPSSDIHKAGNAYQKDVKCSKARFEYQKDDEDDEIHQSIKSAIQSETEQRSNSISHESAKPMSSNRSQNRVKLNSKLQIVENDRIRRVQKIIKPLTVKPLSDTKLNKSKIFDKTAAMPIRKMPWESNKRPNEVKQTKDFSRIIKDNQNKIYPITNVCGNYNKQLYKNIKIYESETDKKILEHFRSTPKVGQKLIKPSNDGRKLSKEDSQFLRWCQKDSFKDIMNKANRQRPISTFKSSEFSDRNQRLKDEEEDEIVAENSISSSNQEFKYKNHIAKPLKPLNVKSGSIPLFKKFNINNIKLAQFRGSSDTIKDEKLIEDVHTKIEEIAVRLSEGSLSTHRLQSIRNSLISILYPDDEFTKEKLEEDEEKTNKLICPEEITKCVSENEVKMEDDEDKIKSVPDEEHATSFEGVNDISKAKETTHLIERNSDRNCEMNLDSIIEDHPKIVRSEVEPQRNLLKLNSSDHEEILKLNSKSKISSLRDPMTNVLEPKVDNPIGLLTVYLPKIYLPKTNATKLNLSEVLKENEIFIQNDPKTSKLNLTKLFDESENTVSASSNSDGSKLLKVDGNGAGNSITRSLASRSCTSWKITRTTNDFDKISHSQVKKNCGHSNQNLLMGDPNLTNFCPKLLSDSSLKPVSVLYSTFKRANIKKKPKKKSRSSGGRNRNKLIPSPPTDDEAKIYDLINKFEKRIETEQKRLNNNVDSKKILIEGKKLLKILKESRNSADVSRLLPKISEWCRELNNDRDILSTSTDPKMNEHKDKIIEMPLKEHKLVKLIIHHPAVMKPRPNKKLIKKNSDNEKHLDIKTKNLDNTITEKPPKTETESPLVVLKNNLITLAKELKNSFTKALEESPPDVEKEQKLSTETNNKKFDSKSGVQSSSSRSKKVVEEKESKIRSSRPKKIPIVKSNSQENQKHFDSFKDPRDKIRSTRNSKITEILKKNVNKIVNNEFEVDDVPVKLTTIETKLKENEISSVPFKSTIDNSKSFKIKSKNNSKFPFTADVNKNTNSKKECDNSKTEKSIGYRDIYSKKMDDNRKKAEARPNTADPIVKDRFKTKMYEEMKEIDYQKVPRRKSFNEKTSGSSKLVEEESPQDNEEEFRANEKDKSNNDSKLKLAAPTNATKDIYSKKMDENRKKVEARSNTADPIVKDRFKTKMNEEMKEIDYQKVPRRKSFNEKTLGSSKLIVEESLKDNDEELRVNEKDKSNNDSKLKFAAPTNDTKDIYSEKMDESRKKVEARPNTADPIIKDWFKTKMYEEMKENDYRKTFNEKTFGSSKLVVEQSLKDNDEEFRANEKDKSNNDSKLKLAAPSKAAKDIYSKKVDENRKKLEARSNVADPIVKDWSKTKMNEEMKEIDYQKVSRRKLFNEKTFGSSKLVVEESSKDNDEEFRANEKDKSDNDSKLKLAVPTNATKDIYSKKMDENRNKVEARPNIADPIVKDWFKTKIYEEMKENGYQKVPRRKSFNEKTIDSSKLVVEESPKDNDEEFRANEKDKSNNDSKLKSTNAIKESRHLKLESLAVKNLQDSIIPFSDKPDKHNCVLNQTKNPIENKNTSKSLKLEEIDNKKIDSIKLSSRNEIPIATNRRDNYSNLKLDKTVSKSISTPNGNKIMKTILSKYCIKPTTRLDEIIIPDNKLASKYKLKETHFSTPIIKKEVMKKSSSSVNAVKQLGTQLEATSSAVEPKPRLEDYNNEIEEETQIIENSSNLRDKFPISIIDKQISKNSLKTAANLVEDNNTGNIELAATSNTCNNATLPVLKSISIARQSQINDDTTEPNRPSTVPDKKFLLMSHPNDSSADTEIEQFFKTEPLTENELQVKKKKLLKTLRLNEEKSKQSFKPNESGKSKQKQFEDIVEFDSKRFPKQSYENQKPKDLYRNVVESSESPKPTVSNQQETVRNQLPTDTEQNVNDQQFQDISANKFLDKDKKDKNKTGIVDKTIKFVQETLYTPTVLNVCIVEGASLADLKKTISVALFSKIDDQDVKILSPSKLLHPLNKEIKLTNTDVVGLKNNSDSSKPDSSKSVDFLSISSNQQRKKLNDISLVRELKKNLINPRVELKNDTSYEPEVKSNLRPQSERVANEVFFESNKDDQKSLIAEADPLIIQKKFTTNNKEVCQPLLQDEEENRCSGCVLKKPLITPKNYVPKYNRKMMMYGIPKPLDSIMKKLQSKQKNKNSTQRSDQKRKRSHEKSHPLSLDENSDYILPVANQVSTSSLKMAEVKEEINSKITNQNDEVLKMAEVKEEINSKITNKNDEVLKMAEVKEEINSKNNNQNDEVPKSGTPNDLESFYTSKFERRQQIYGKRGENLTNKKGAEKK